MADNKWLWLDLETTGLDETRDKILEVGIIITDFNFDTLFEKSYVVKQPSHVLQNMNPFVRKMHSENGLSNECILAKDDLQMIEAKVCEVLQAHFKNKIVLAGGGIHFDRRFIKVHMPQLESLLHYRMLDVSAFNLLFTSLQLPVHTAEKKKIHRSLSDIRESIDELKFYSSLFRLGAVEISK